MGSRAHNFLIHRINRKIAQQLPYRGRVIDLGCGIAPYKQIILGVADSYVGVDWPKSFHGNPNTDVYASLRERLPFRGACADTVVSFQVVEHLPDPNTLLAEAQRILRPGGSLFLTIPFMWLVHEAPFDYCRYTRHGLQHLLQKHGFVEIEIRENTGFWQMWSLKFNYHTQRPHSPIKYLLLPVWLLGQVITPWMDRIDKHPEETASYTVLAKSPG